MFFKGNYLRVLTPKTTDGVNLVLDNDTRVYKEDFLPLSARRDLELQNKYLPDVLKKKIEVVSSDSISQKETGKKK